jgi:glycosyltransferase involved in cell wall biosynthesis
MNNLLIRKKVLFISYDGLLDQLGASQILPYLEGLASRVYKIHIISFEKREKISKKSLELNQRLEDKGIYWHPLIFSSKYGIFGKVFDAIKMQCFSFYLSWKNSIDIIHCRSHLPAITGGVIKLIFGTKLLFDFRGLWVDERIDKGGWKTEFLFHRIQYQLFKIIEKFLISSADHIVVLTEKVIKEINNLGEKNAQKITVIPCCADYSHFKIFDDCLSPKKDLNIPENSTVIGYLGSVGKMYMIKDLLFFFKAYIADYPSSILLIITEEIDNFMIIATKELNPEQLANIRIQSASREKVPQLINIMDVMVMFCVPSYARIAACPTKMGESLACGVPIISNEGIGDVSEIISKISGGIILHDTSSRSIAYGIEEFQKGNFLSGDKLRKASKEIFSLDLGIEKYTQVYESIYI